MTLRRDFAMVTAFKSVCVGLSEASCDHLEHLDLSDVDRYFQVSAEANSIAEKFFNSFWSMGGNDMAIMNAALSRGKVLAYLVYFLVDLFVLSICFRCET